MLYFWGYTSPMDPASLGNRNEACYSTTPRVRMVCSQPNLMAQVNMTLAVVEPWNHFGLQWMNVCYLTVWICRHMFDCFPESRSAPSSIGLWYLIMGVLYVKLAHESSPASLHCSKQTKNHRENGGTLGMVPLKINPIYTSDSGYLLGI